MRTVQFGDAFPPIMDGVCVTMMNYAKWLHEKHGDCTVVAPNIAGYVDQTPYKVYRFPSIDSLIKRPYRVGVPSLAPSFQRKMRHLDCDLVHTHSPYVAGEEAYKMARRLGVPLVATFHSKFRDDFYAAFGSNTMANIGVGIAVRFFEKADYVWAVNSPTADTLRSYGYRGEIEIMPNGCDKLSIADPQSAITELNRTYGIDPGETVFLFVGQQVWHKNIKLVLDAVRLYFSENPGRLVLVGEGGNAEEIRKYVAADALLAQRVIFTGKILDREKLFAFYLRAHALLFPSLYDNAPLVVREAASVGCPPVLARGSHAAEDFKEDSEVFLCGTTPESLAQKIQDIVENRPLYERVKTGCRDIAIPWEQIVDRVAERYGEIITSWQGR